MPGYLPGFLFSGIEIVRHINIHMNGRIYDADIGRFLQADPHIQAPNNAQNYNRYSYVLNNPMTYTDPSGYFFKKLFKSLTRFMKKYGRVILAAVATYVTHGLAGKLFGSAIIQGAVAGAAGGFVATGSLRGAAYGALSGAVFGAIGAHGRASGWGEYSPKYIASHAVAGGVLSKVQGGKFGHGFISAGIMKGVGWIETGANYGRVIVQSIVGGTVSKITGGKFANGAVTSAIQYVVNEIASASEQKGPTLNRETGQYTYNGKVVTPFVDEIPGFDWHKDRNIFNRVPSSMPERTVLGRRGRSPIYRFVDSEGGIWSADNPVTSGYFHGWENTTFRGTGINAGSQATYSPSGQLVDSGIYMGTFDYGPAGTAAHVELDVKPHTDDPHYTPNLSTRF